MANQIFDTYHKSVIPHGNNIYQTASDMDMATMCAYLLYQHTLTHWRCVLCCCSNCPCIDIPNQESNHNNPTHVVQEVLMFKIWYHSVQSMTVRQHNICCQLCLIILASAPN